MQLKAVSKSKIWLKEFRLKQLLEDSLTNSQPGELALGFTYNSAYKCLKGIHRLAPTEHLTDVLMQQASTAAWTILEHQTRQMYEELDAVRHESGFEGETFDQNCFAVRILSGRLQGYLRPHGLVNAATITYECWNKAENNCICTHPRSKYNTQVQGCLHEGTCGCGAKGDLEIYGWRPTRWTA